MKKFISVFLSLLLLSSLLSLSAQASDKYTLIYDEYNLLNEEDANELRYSLASICRNWGFHIAVAIKPSLDGENIIDASRKFYEENDMGVGENKDGILLLINEGERDCYVYANGSAEMFLDEFDCGDLSITVSGILSSGDIKSAVYGFLAGTSQMIVEDALFLEDFDGSSFIPEERILPRVIDNAGLLSFEEEQQLIEELDTISEYHMCDVSLATVNDTDIRTASEFADDWYDFNRYGYGSERDGIILILSMEDRDWAISTRGSAEDNFTQAGTDYIAQSILPDLSSGNYFDAFSSYASLCDELLSSAAAGNIFDEEDIPKEPMGTVNYMIPLIFALFTGFAGTWVLKSQLTSVKMQQSAGNYADRSSLNVPERHDLFLYRNITRTAKPKNNSSSGGGSISGGGSHMSSSGSSHGGSSGKF